MKREGVKRKTSNNWDRVFQITLKGGEGSWEFCLKDFLPFNTFTIMQIRFSKHWLMKISMIYLYIKPEVKKEWYNSNDCNYKWSLYWVITWNLLFGEGDISGAGNEHYFCCWVGFFPHLQGFPWTVGLGNRQGSPYMMGAASKIKGG